MTPLILTQLQQQSRRILLAGAGGGFDIFAGLPLFFWLRSLGKEVHLANLSFTELESCEGIRPVPEVLSVTPESSGSWRYFPERHLSCWLAEQGHALPIHAIARSGAAAVARAYTWLAESLAPDTIILVDGGTDILMCGDEAGLGTPQEDIASLAAVAALPDTIHRYITCLGFGADTFHGVCHAQFLENVATLIGDGGFLGSWSLLRESEEFQKYETACQYVHDRMPWRSSIVNTSVIASANGWFGNRHPTSRTEGGRLFLNALMAQYWAFDLNAVARRNLYLDQIRDTESYHDLSLRIELFRARLPRKREWVEIPF